MSADDDHAVSQEDRELDERIRAAAKLLDARVPSRYFDDLDQRTLARLESGPGMANAKVSMGNTNSDSEAVARSAALAASKSTAAAASDGTPQASDDSGLHDIRSLAQNTKRRLSAKITAQQQVIDDPLVSTSGSWRAVALPEPAKMVALPALSELPSKAEIIARDKAATAAAKTAPAAPLASTSAAASASADASITPIASAPRAAATAAASATARNPDRTKTIAISVAAVAAAAGLAVYVFTRPSSDAPVVARANVSGPVTPAPTVEPIAKPTPPVAVAPAPTPTPTVDTPPVAVAPTPTPTPVVTPTEPTTHKATARTPAKPTTDNAAAPAVAGADPSLAPAVKTKKGDDGEPSFDALLKEAGVSDKPKQSAPKLDKKELSIADITNSMSALSGKAQACFKGTQGTAMVKLTVAPSGKITSVHVGGAFAGAPEGDCVANIARNAQFPPWDGSPQTVSYSYLLSE